MVLVFQGAEEPLDHANGLRASHPRADVPQQRVVTRERVREHGPPEAWRARTSRAHASLPLARRGALIRLSRRRVRPRHLFEPPFITPGSTVTVELSSSSIASESGCCGDGSETDEDTDGGECGVEAGEAGSRHEDR